MPEALVRVPATGAGLQDGVVRQVLPQHPDVIAHNRPIHAHGTIPLVNSSGYRDVPWMDGQIRCRADNKYGVQCGNWIDPGSGDRCLSHVQSAVKVSYKDHVAAASAARRAAEGSASEG